MVWIDVESLGLDPDLDPIIELGIIVTDKLGSERARFQRIIGSYAISSRLYPDTMAAAVFEMHTKSGLIREVRGACDEVRFDEYASSHRRSRVEQDALNFLADHFPDANKSVYMAGASVQFDRAMLLRQMPTLHNWFHYRQHDVSTILSLMSMAGVQPDESVTSRKIHRSIPDCEDEISVHAWAMRVLYQSRRMESELEHINKELRSTGIIDPVVPRGVQTLAAFYEVAQNELKEAGIK